MKLLLIVVLVAMAASAQGWDLKCGLDGFTFTGSGGEFQGWSSGEISFGSCTLDDAWSLVNAKYVDCGAQVTVEGYLLHVKAVVKSAPITTVITRKKPVNFPIGCTFHTKTLQSTTASFEPIIGTTGGLVSKTGKAIQFTMSYESEDGETHVNTGEPLKIPVGTDMKVKISGPDLATFGIFATISDCFATPSADPNDSTYYSLVSKTCVTDDDVTVEREGNDQILKFRSFAFTEYSTAMTYLHCDVFACTERRLNRCRMCSNTDWKSISQEWIRAWNARVRIAMVFEPDTVETLSIKNLRCKQNGVQFMGNQASFPLWDAKDIFLGTCPLNDDFNLIVTYDQCGLKVKERRHQLLMQTFITAKVSKKDGVVSRKRPINYMIRCGYDRFARVSTHQGLGAIMPEAVSMGTFTRQPDMFLNLLDERGFKIDRQTLEVNLNETVVAIIGGKDVESLKMRLYAVDCFVTPTYDGTGDIKHDLLTKSCPADPTFKAEQFGSGQRLSFDAFAFTHDSKAKLYLHCDVAACLLDSQCGQCNQAVSEDADPVRRKRSTFLSWQQHLDASAGIHVAYE